MLEKNELFSQHIEQHPRVAHSQQYGYDLNGNIVDIRYNRLNLPERVTWADGRRTEHTYAADGRKLRT